MLAKFALRNVSRNRRRSIVAVATVGIGVFGLLFLQSFFSGLLAMHADNSIHSRHGHGQVTTKGYWGQSFETPSDHWIENPQIVVAALRADPAVLEAFPRVQFFSLLSNGKVNVAGRGQGVDGAREQTFFTKMNYIAGGPIATHEDGIVLGVGLATALGVAVGDRVTVLGHTVHNTINAIDTTVTGIFHVGLKEADDMLFQVQISQAHILLDTDKVESIAIGLKNDNAWAALTPMIAREFPQLEAMSVFEIDKVWAENGRLFLTALMNVFRLTLVGMILLAIYNSASNTVLERKRELGMLRANGESAGDLVRLLVIEGTALAVMGSALGVFLILATNLIAAHGIIMPPTPGTNRALPVKLDLQWAHIASAVAIGVFASLAATLLSTLQVTRLSIVKAIRAPL